VFEGKASQISTGEKGQKGGYLVRIKQARGMLWSWKGGALSFHL